MRSAMFHAGASGDSRSAKAYAYAFVAFTLLFFLRVLAQALAAFFDLAFLPSMKAWVVPSASPFSTSGFIPYPVLLSIQAVILALQFQVCRDFLRGQGYFVSFSGRTGRILLWLGYAYIAAMALRYIVTMALYPERRWLGHTVPIALHFVLAGFLLTLGRYTTKQETVLK